MSLIADEEASEEAARALFDAVHPYWASLPPAERPQLYLFGMSLGSYGVESVLSSVDLFANPVDGVLLVGPPFINELRNELTDARDPESPEWLPVYRGGETVRFMSTDTESMGPWEGIRILYLQHASDPMSFFATDLAFVEPDWLRDGRRGPDVSEEMWWLPIVTMWQVAFDLPSTGSVPRGHGHLFTPAEYLDAWLAVTRPIGVDPADIERLKSFFEASE